MHVVVCTASDQQRIGGKALDELFSDVLGLLLHRWPPYKFVPSWPKPTGLAANLVQHTSFAARTISGLPPLLPLRVVANYEPALVGAGLHARFHRE